MIYLKLFSDLITFSSWYFQEKSETVSTMSRETWPTSMQGAKEPRLKQKCLAPRSLAPQPQCSLGPWLPSWSSSWPTLCTGTTRKTKRRSSTRPCEVMQPGYPFPPLDLRVFSVLNVLYGGKLSVWDIQWTESLASAKPDDMNSNCSWIKVSISSPPIWPYDYGSTAFWEAQTQRCITTKIISSLFALNSTNIIILT